MSQFCPECPMRGLCEGDIAGVVSIETIQPTVSHIAPERMPESTEIVVVVDVNGMPSQPMVHTSKAVKREVLGVRNRFETKTALELISKRLNKCHNPVETTKGIWFRRKTGQVACGALSSNLDTGYDYYLSPFSAEKLDELKIMSQTMRLDELYRTIGNSLEFNVEGVA